MGDDTQAPIKPLEPDQWAQDLQNVYTDMKGAPINVHKLMAHSPDLLGAWWGFRNYVVDGGTLGQRLGELVILRVGAHLSSWYEWGSHVDRATRIGMDRNTIFEALNPQPDLPKPEALILRAVDELMIGHRITDPTRLELNPHFSTAQQMDLIAIQGMYVILGGFINTWTLELDPIVAERIAPLTNREEFEAAATKFRQELTSG